MNAMTEAKFEQSIYYLKYGRSYFKQKKCLISAPLKEFYRKIYCKSKFCFCHCMHMYEWNIPSKNY